MTQLAIHSKVWYFADVDTPPEATASPSPDDVAKWLLGKQTQITAYVRVIVHDMQTAEDIFQEVCVSAIQVSADFDSEEGSIRWAMKVGRNKAIDYLRRTRKEVVVLSPELLDKLSNEWIGRSHDPQWQDRQHSLYKNLEHCIGKLTKRTRSLLDMRYREGKKPNEIAVLLNQKVVAIYKTFTRANTSLKSCMEKLTTTAE